MTCIPKYNTQTVQTSRFWNVFCQFILGKWPPSLLLKPAANVLYSVLSPRMAVCNGRKVFGLQNKSEEKTMTLYLKQPLQIRYWGNIFFNPNYSNWLNFNSRAYIKGLTRYISNVQSDHEINFKRINNVSHVTDLFHSTRTVSNAILSSCTLRQWVPVRKTTWRRGLR